MVSWCRIAGHGMGPFGVAASGARQAVFAVARQGAFGTAAGKVAPLCPPRFLAADAMPALAIVGGKHTWRVEGVTAYGMSHGS